MSNGLNDTVCVDAIHILHIPVHTELHFISKILQKLVIRSHKEPVL